MRITAKTAEELIACQKPMLKGVFFKTYEPFPSGVRAQYKVCDRRVKLEHSETSSRVRLPHLNNLNMHEILN